MSRINNFLKKVKELLSKRSIIISKPRELNTREEWCKNFIDGNRGKFHEDVGLTVWSNIFDLDNCSTTFKECKILAYRESFEPDGTQYSMIVKDVDGKYDSISVHDYFYEKPEEWAMELDFWKRRMYIRKQKELVSYKKELVGRIPSDEEMVNILYIEKELLDFKPILTKSELREDRFKKLLDR